MSAVQLELEEKKPEIVTIDKTATETITVDDANMTSLQRPSSDLAHKPKIVEKPKKTEIKNSNRWYTTKAANKIFYWAMAVLEIMVALNSLIVMAVTLASYVGVDADLAPLQPIYQEWTTPFLYNITIKAECSAD